MELGEVYVKIGADIVPLEKALGKARTVTKNTTEQMRAQMKTLGMGMVIAGAAITAAFALTVKSAIGFQKELAQVSTMLDESAMKIMPQYKKGLLDMSVAFGESTDTLSRGLYDILSASIPPAKALDVLGIAATAATAGITDTGVAADAITTILNSYGMQAEDAGKVSDILFAVVKRGKLTFDELAPAIGKSAALASQSGLSFEDLGATIATLTRAGIRTSEAMTSINGVLRAFLKPTDDAKEAAEEFGLELNTNTLRTLGMTGVMEKLTGATAEQLAAIFPNIRGLKGMAAALGDTEGYAKDYTLMLNSAGLTQEAFTKQSATLGFKIDQLKKSFSVVATTVGDVLIPVVQKIVEYIMTLVLKMKEWMDAHPGLTKAIVLLGAALGVLTGAGGVLILGALYFTKLKTTMMGVSATSNTVLVPALGRLRIALNTLGGAIIVAQANLIIWFEVWKEYQKIMDATVVTAESIKEAELRMAKAQEATAKKLDITIERYREYLEAGLSVTEMIERGSKEIKRGAVDWGTYNEELRWLTELAKSGGISAQELYKAMHDLAIKTGVLIEKTTELEPVIGTIVTNVKGLQQELIMVSKEYEAYGKSVSDSIEYHGQMIEKLDQIDVVLQTELMLLKEGTEEYNKKKEEILDNLKVLKDYQEALEGMLEPLKGLDLIAAQIGLLGDSFADNQAKMVLLGQEADILRQKIEEAIPKTAKWWEWSNALKDNEEKIRSLSQAIAESELARLDAELAYLNKKFKESGESVEGYRAKINTLNEIMVVLKQRLEEAEPDTEEWYKWALALETNEDRIKELNQALKDLKSSAKGAKDAVKEVSTGLVETGEAGKEAGKEVVKSWTLVGDTIKRATASLSNFTREGVAAAIATIKMKFYPAIQSLSESIAALFGKLGVDGYNLARYYERQIEILTESMNEQIQTVLYGWEEYKNTLIDLSGIVEEKIGKNYENMASDAKKSGKTTILSWKAVSNTANKSARAMVSSWKKVTDTVDETAEAVSKMASSWKSVTSAASEAVEATGWVGATTTEMGLTSYQHGTSYVPRTGLAMVHKGEEINPPGQRSYDQRSYDQKRYTSSINIQPGAIVINTPKFSDRDAAEMLAKIKRRAAMQGYKFATA